ncbi:MAG: hypothetical protein ACE5G0_10450 [Rhodothermales bacterium]
MNDETSFLKGNLALVFTLAFILLAFVGGWLSSALKSEEPTPQRAPSFSIEELSRQPGLSSPAATASILFEAIKRKDVATLEPCLLTEREFNEVKGAFETLPASYPHYREQLLAPFRGMMASLDAMVSSSVLLDSVSEGERIQDAEFTTVDRLDMVLSFTDSLYASKQIKITLPTFVKTSSGTYKLLQ